MVMRFVLFFAGLMVAAPVGGVAGLNHTVLTLTGAALAILPFAVAWRASRDENLDPGLA